VAWWKNSRFALVTSQCWCICNSQPGFQPTRFSVEHLCVPCKKKWCIWIWWTWFDIRWFYFWRLAFDCRGTVSMGPKRLIEHVVLAYAYLIIPIQIRWRMHSPIFPSLVKWMQPWPWMLVNSHMAMCAESISSPSWVKTTACMACTPLKAKTELPKRRGWKDDLLRLGHGHGPRLDGLAGPWLCDAVSGLVTDRRLTDTNWVSQWRIPGILTHDASSSTQNCGLFSRWAMQRLRRAWNSQFVGNLPSIFFLYSSSFKTG